MALYPEQLQCQAQSHSGQVSIIRPISQKRKPRMRNELQAANSSSLTPGLELFSPKRATPRSGVSHLRPSEELYLNNWVPRFLLARLTLAF